MTDIDRLRTALGAQAEQVSVNGDLAVRAIAAERRRQRRTTTGGIAAIATLVVVSPFAWWSVRANQPPVAPVASSAIVQSQSPTLAAPTPTPSTPPASGPTPATGTPSTSPTSLSSPALPAPDDTYALDDTIRFGDRVIQLQKGTVVENFAVLSNGGFFLQSHMSTGVSQSEMEVLDPRGYTVTALGPAGVAAVAPDGTAILAKSGISNTVIAYAPDGSVIGRRTDNRDPAAIVGDYAYLNGPTSSLEWNIRTGATRTLPAHVVAVSPDRTRAALQWEEAGSNGTTPGCWSVVDLTRPDFTTLLKRCGTNENPTWFTPTSFSSHGTYLVGNNFVDGGFWFLAAVVRVSDGTVVVGSGGAPVASGWTWRLTEDETALVISRNTTDVVSPATHNTLQRCTLALTCTDLQPELPLDRSSTPPAARYVVPR